MTLAAQDLAGATRAVRLDWVDALRGFAILLVVIGHSWRGLFSAGLMPAETFAGPDRAIYAFHMPLFFVLAGLFFVPGLQRAASVRSFARNRVWRLLYPLLLWTYLFIVAKALAGPLANTPMRIEEIWVSPLPGRWHFWFLWALLLVSLALLPLRALLTDPERRGPAALALLAVSLGLQALPLPHVLMHWIGPAVAMLPYFVMGILVGPLLARLPATGAGALLAAALFAALLVWTALRPDPVQHRLVLATAMSGLAVLAFAGAQPLPDPLGRLLRWMGTGTMAIFLTHTFFSAALRACLLSLGWQDLASHMVLSVIVGVLGPLWLLSLARRAGIDRALGF